MIGSPSASDSELSAPKASARVLALLALVAVVAFGVDQLSKMLVVQNLPFGEPVPILGPVLHFTFVLNQGAAFSLGSGSTWIFAILAAVAAILIIVFARRIRSVAWACVFGLLLGGTLGNLTDRLLRPPALGEAPVFGQGAVVDFIQVWGFPAIFNMADVAIVSSMALFVILTLRGVRLDGGGQAESRSETDA